MTNITKDNKAPAVSPLLRKNDMMTDAVSAFLLPTDLKGDKSNVNCRRGWPMLLIVIV